MSVFHICSFDDGQTYKMELEGKTYWFDFSDRFGPLFLTKDGRVLERQPTHDRIINMAVRTRNEARAAIALARGETQ